VKPACDAENAQTVALAKVIELHPLGPFVEGARAGRPSAAPAAPAAPIPSASRDVALLERRVGARWAEMPTGLSRPTAALERDLAHGPTSLDTTRVSPAEALGEAWLVADAAAARADALVEESGVLGEALGALLVHAPLRRLLRIAGAVLDVARTGPAEPAWGDPARAQLASVVLEAHGDDLRACAAVHHEVYERFTDAVWGVPKNRLAAASRGWRLVLRLRLRRELAAVSRTGRLPGSLDTSLELLLRARAAREQADQLAPILERQLGRHHHGPVTDVDAASAALRGVRELHEALGEELDSDRLVGLLLAEAFSQPEVTGPAMALHTELQAWAAEVAQLCGGEPWALPADELAQWAARVRSGLRRLSGGLAALNVLGCTPRTVSDLVDDLILRDHAEESLAALRQAVGEVIDGMRDHRGGR
jgi:hypothetical protein